MNCVRQNIDLGHCFVLIIRLFVKKSQVVCTQSTGSQYNSSLFTQEPSQILEVT